MTPILLNWEASNTFGWGIVGLQVFAQWALSDDIQPVMGMPVSLDVFYQLDDARRRIAQRVDESNRLLAQLRAKPGPIIVDFPVIHSLGNAFCSSIVDVIGGINIGRIVFDDTRTLEHAQAKSLPFEFLVCMSQWNADLLRQSCSAEVVLAHEGVDTSLFLPGPKSAMFEPGRFYVFSGGKIEYRKAQDLVLLAFKRFAARHDDAILVTNWNSPWPAATAGFQGRLDWPLHLDTSGRPDIARWVADNGVDPSRVLALPPIANQALPQVLRNMDCALFPSRCEGCTNLVAMEAMACAVPTVLAPNTGVRDIIEDGNCIALQHQRPVEGFEGVGTDGWTESDVEELTQALEQLYESASLRSEIGSRGAAFMSHRTWKKHSDAMKGAALGASTL